MALSVFFFFQAEDGIRGLTVTGVQTCALPICIIVAPPALTLAVARAVKAGGATMMRAGVWKPRTSPFSFPGLGSEGLAIVGEAKAETGLPVVTELTSSEHAEELAAVVDVIQVGARNMQNYGLLQVV